MPHPQQKIALDVILAEEGNGGLSPAAILLHKKQAEDAEKMDKRMNDIERKVDTLDRKVDGIEEKIDTLKILIESKGKFLKNLNEVLSNKVFLYLLITFICVAFGVSVGEVGTFLFKQ